MVKKLGEKIGVVLKFELMELEKQEDEFINKCRLRYCKIKVH